MLIMYIVWLQSKKRSKIKPLVLASFVAARDMYLVVGVIGAPRVGDTSLLHKYACQAKHSENQSTQPHRLLRRHLA